MTPAEIILAAVTLQRAGELVFSSYNTRRLLARGAIEVTSGHYPLVVAVHGAWLLSLWLLGRDHPVVGSALLVYLLLQGCRHLKMCTSNK